MGWKHPSRNSEGNLQGISNKDLQDMDLIKKYGGYGEDGNNDKKQTLMTTMTLFTPLQNIYQN